MFISSLCDFSICVARFTQMKCAGAVFCKYCLGNILCVKRYFLHGFFSEIFKEKTVWFKLNVDGKIIEQVMRLDYLRIVITRIGDPSLEVRGQMYWMGHEYHYNCEMLHEKINIKQTIEIKNLLKNGLIYCEQSLTTTIKQMSLDSWNERVEIYIGENSDR